MRKLILFAVILCLIAGCSKMGPRMMTGATNGEAALELGDIFLLEPDYQKAAAWYYKSAIQNNAQGSHKLADMYDTGTGVELNHTEAAYWYKKGAERGYAPSQYKFALMSMEGDGVEQDYGEAAKWMSKAASNGNPEAQKYLADFYKDGTGIKQSDKNAVKWYTKAAEQGNTDAQMILGDAYSAGLLSMKADPVKSCVWLSVAGMDNRCAMLEPKDAAKANKEAAAIMEKIAKQ